jgi:hypothetical protein
VRGRTRFNINNLKASGIVINMAPRLRRFKPFEFHDICK